MVSFRCKNNACGGEIDFLFVSFLLFLPKIKGLFSSNQSNIIPFLKTYSILDSPEVGIQNGSGES